MAKKSKKIRTARSRTSNRNNAHHGPGHAHFWLATLAIAVLSYSVLTFEIALTRIFSVMLSYHFVFAAISFALLGLGLGGMLLAHWRRWLPKTGYQTDAALMALAIFVSVATTLKLPFYQSGSTGGSFWIYITLTTLPFFFAGLTFAGLFQTFAARSSVLYGLDLLGATVAALAVVPLLNALGGVSAAFLAALAAACGSVILACARPDRSIGGLAKLAVFVLMPIGAGWAIFEGNVPIATDQSKDMYRMLNSPRDQAVLVESRWSAFGRTDLVKSALPPDDMTIFVDGSAGSPMYNLNSIFNDSRQREHLITSFGAYFPFYFLAPEQKNSALVIGSGGGRDVVLALLGGVEEITAVEVNPDVVEIVRDYEEFSGGLYTRHPKVQVVVAEGRNYIRSQNTRYDLIMLAIPVTKSSRSVEGYALTENYMFTVESMSEYFDRLTPEGRIVLVGHSGPEIYRLMTLALTVFEKRGLTVPAAMKHMYTMASGRMPTLIVQKKPFQLEEIQTRYERMQQLGFDKLLFVPYWQEILTAATQAQEPTQTGGTFDPVLARLATGEMTLGQLIAGSGVDISPVTDDSPFFYKFEPGLPPPFGVFSIFIVLFTATLLGLISLRKPKPGSPLNRISLLREVANSPHLKSLVLLFFFIGVGFMMLEIALFQKLTLYLGQPLLALSVLLFSLLLGTGLGSLASATIHRRKISVLRMVSASIVVLALTYALTLEFIFQFGFDARVTAMVLLVPLGIALGFPFPLGIRIMKDCGLGQHVYLMWGLNGMASVLGSALTMIVGIAIGFSYAIFFAAALYAGVVAVASVLKKLDSDELLNSTSRPQTRQSEQVR